MKNKATKTLSCMAIAMFTMLLLTACPARGEGIGHMLGDPANGSYGLSLVKKNYPYNEEGSDFLAGTLRFKTDKGLSSLSIRYYRDTINYLDFSREWSDYEHDANNELEYGYFRDNDDNISIYPHEWLIYRNTIYWYYYGFSQIVEDVQFCETENGGGIVEFTHKNPLLGMLKDEAFFIFVYNNVGKPYSVQVFATDTLSNTQTFTYNF